MRERKEGVGPGGPQDRVDLDRYKEFGPASFAIDHRVSILVLLVIIAVMGVFSYMTIPKESSPEIEIPMIAVNTLYQGASPADVETQVTRILEEDLNTISDLETLTSTSVEGYSSITAEFATGVDIDDALQKVREKVDLARPDLPDDIEEPTIVEFNFSEFPIMQVNLSGEYGLVRLKEIGEELQDRLEQISTVLRVDLSGGLEREVKVEVDLSKIQYYNLSIQDVIDAIREEHVNVPGGSIDVGPRKYLVRVDGEFRDPTLIEDLVIAVQNGRPIYVRDVASVDFGFADRESFARMDGNPVVTLGVVKRSGENIIQTAEAVRAVIADMQPLFPPTTEVKVTGDQSEDIHDMVNSLENNIISGLLLIVAVLLFYLGLRTSLFVAVAIPSSMLLSFVVLKALGVTMNMVVLFSLILALGMLVDNAIVIVENIYRYLEEGWDRDLAAKKATGEVAMPVIAATLTTLAAFAPLLFWPGIAGEFMKFLPMTLIVTLSSSLFVALVIVPTLCAMFIKLDTDEGRKPFTRAARWTLIGGSLFAVLIIASMNWLAAVLLTATAAILFLVHTRVMDHLGHRFREDMVPRVLTGYERQLRWALNHRLAIVGGAVFAFVLTVMAFGRFNHGVEYFPEDIPPGQLLVDVETPVGSRADFTDEIVQRMEQELRAVDGYGDAESVVATSGGNGGGGPMGGGGGGENSGRVSVTLVDYQDRGQDAFQTLANMQAALGRDVAGAEVSVDKFEDGPTQGPPVNLEIIGEDPSQLEQLSDQVLEILRNAPVFEKLVGLESNLDDARPELSIQVDRERAALFDLSTFEIGNAVRGAIQGIEAAKYRTGNDEYDIVVRLAPEWRSDLSALEDLTVMTEGTQVPLVSVARWDVDDGYGSIQRKDLDRVAVISSDVRAGYNQNAVLGEVQGTLAEFQESLPPGYQVRYTGQNEEQQEAQAFLTNAFLVALALIGLILVSQFNSVVKPVIILTSVVMSTVGVLIGLMVFRMPFVIIMTGVGVISLAGIVVNNAIVLIDYIDILRERDGMDRREALVQGGMTRFRPVVLTAVTTALGLVPLAVGLNFDFIGLYTGLDPALYWGGEQASWWGPMAVAVIVGILIATVLTLILVPVLYSLVDDIANFFRRVYVGTEGAEEAEGETSSAEEGPVTGPPVRPAPEREPAAVYFHPGMTDPQPES